MRSRHHHAVAFFFLKNLINEKEDNMKKDCYTFSRMEKRKEESVIPSKPRFFSVRRICTMGISLALMCVLSPLSIPLEPVPITLATLVLYLLGSILDPLSATLTIFLYLLLGAAGLPVFSKYQAGFSTILGPTGGFLLGYLPCVFLESLLLYKRANHKWIYPIAMLLGTIVLYAFGTTWLILSANYEIGKAMAIAVLPFLPGDAIKITLASLLGVRLRPLLQTHQ